MPLPDPIQEGIKGGWTVVDASKLEKEDTVECDVAIVGTGAGGGTAAEVLSAAGLSVVLLEEGPLKSSSDFNLHEKDAYREIYREGFSSFSKDRGIVILQGRCVGGSTVVNWTSSFPTPELTLRHWSSELGLREFEPALMAPWFEQVKKRLNWTEWTNPNVNNDILKRGCEKLGLNWGYISRNVKNCWNLGYCGLGCPTNAKQSMLVTTIPRALEEGAELVYNAHVEKLELDGNKAVAIHTGKLTVRARHFILAAGAIQTPGILLRSKVHDPGSQIGKRTFLHPTTFTIAKMAETVNAYSEAPQSVYSDHFNWSDGPKGAMGYKLEVPPLYPMFATGLVNLHGNRHAEWMKDYTKLHGIIALMRDGFHPESPGGTVSLRPDGSAVVDYNLSAYILDGMKRSFLTAAEIQFAAGAQAVLPNHLGAEPYSSWQEAHAGIQSLSMKPDLTLVGSAHVMGGSAMGTSPKDSVTDSEGRLHLTQNVSVMDGSLFPTSIGTNPTMSICALTMKLATQLAKRLKA